VVGHLNDPRYSGTLLRIEGPRFLENEEENILEQVLGFTVVSQNASRNMENLAGMTLKQN
jgi:hypothetical protein